MNRNRIINKNGNISKTCGDGYKRNVNMDLVRIVAVFSVVSIHFFLNSDFYSIEIGSRLSYLAISMRTLFAICVPMFIMLTGYLMINKILSKNYYKGIAKTFITYVLISISVWVFRNVYLEDDLSFWELIRQIFSGTMWYSWYMEMYFGLFLLIPFLNIIYNHLKSKKEKIILLITFISLTSLPSIINDIYDIIPNYWLTVYPITYYFIGAFIREFGIKIKKRYILLTLIICLLAFAGFNFYRSYGGNFEWGGYCNWYGFENIIDTVLVFSFINNLNLEKLPMFVKKCLGKVSELALGIYLSSSIFDEIFYTYLNSAVPDFESRLKYYVIIVPCVFICALIFSWIINFFTKCIILFFKRTS